jgi:NDP-sugar pyrophosphorylase family protein
MAAGLGSRYGGIKQMEGVGPCGEILMEYSIHDALRAGFEKIVFIIKPEMREAVEELCGRYVAEKAEVAYAYQDFSSLPEWYTMPEGRTKPYGTVHALLCARDVVEEPFCVLNADDYYGVGAYQTMSRALENLADSGEAAMVGYLLKNTVSLHGTVSRGLCTVGEGKLLSVAETKEIQLYHDGTIKDTRRDAVLDGDTVVSMNYWGFMPSIFPVLETYFEAFLRSGAGAEEKSECLLPVMVDDLRTQNALEVSVLSSPDKWFGMTYRADREAVAEELRKLHAEGVYPEGF